MQNLSYRNRVAAPVLCSLLAGLAVGCGAGNFTSGAPTAVAVAGVALKGKAYGGQQPVAGATIQLYAASTSGYGAAATALITGKVVKSDAGGGFSISSDYTCPSSDAQVYITATGGNPGLSANNPNLAMMAALGSCGTLLANAANTFININELTTVGSVYALAPFMSGYASIGSSLNNKAGLALAFADANLLANTSTGGTPGPTLPAGALAPTAEIDTLANILASCINSTGGTAGDATNCGRLFAATTPAGSTTAPTDTIAAALSIAQHPGNNVAALFLLSAPVPPFQPALATPPNDWTVAVSFTGSLGAASSVAIDAAGNVWLTSKSTNTVSRLTHAGAVVSGSPYSSAGIAGPSSVAIDSNGEAWIANATNNSLTHLSATGSLLAQATGGGLNVPSSVAIDPQGNVWAADSGANTISTFTSAGAASSSTGYSGTGIANPLAVAISAH